MDRVTRTEAQFQLRLLQFRVGVAIQVASEGHWRVHCECGDDVSRYGEIESVAECKCDYKYDEYADEADRAWYDLTSGCGRMVQEGDLAAKGMIVALAEGKVRQADDLVLLVRDMYLMDHKRFLPLWQDADSASRHFGFVVQGRDLRESAAYVDHATKVAHGIVQEPQGQSGIGRSA